jgi:phenylacetic acid degradation protein
VVAALAFVKAEAKIPAGALAAGIPARVLRPLTAQELDWKKHNMHLYQQLAQRSTASMREVEALTEIEPDRKRIDIKDAVPLSELKKRQA